MASCRGNQTVLSRFCRHGPALATNAFDFLSALRRLGAMYTARAALAGSTSSSGPGGGAACGAAGSPSANARTNADGCANQRLARLAWRAAMCRLVGVGRCGRGGTHPASLPSGAAASQRATVSSVDAQGRRSETRDRGGLQGSPKARHRRRATRERGRGAGDGMTL